MATVLQELRRALLIEMGARLTKFGFVTGLKDQSFYKNIDCGRAAVHLSFIKHAYDFDATVDVAIRFDAVEDLLHKADMRLSKKEKKDTFTLGTELGNLETGEQYRVSVASEEDIRPAADAIETKFKTVGLTYLERYSGLAAAYDALSRDDREGWIHSPINFVRAKRACALLVVMGRRSEISELGARKLAFLKSMDDPQTAEFYRFLKELEDE